MEKKLVVERQGQDYQCLFGVLYNISAFIRATTGDLLLFDLVLSDDDMQV